MTEDRAAVDLGELRRLLEAATPGPWTERGRDVDHDKFVADGKNPADVCGLGCEVEGPPEAWHRGQFERHADAALIVAAVNALPSLLDALDAADELARIVVEEFHDQEGERPYLRAALSRYRAARGREEQPDGP